jgi:carbonic anhydrase
MDIARIFKNNQDWVQKKLNVEPEYFSELSKGQTPDILYIGCSDSRVSAEELMGVSPGEVFVLRNIANMVPNTDLGVMSVVNYAVLHLKVNHIVVCGHYYCGGVQAAMKSEDLGILNPWLRNIRDVYRMHKDELSNIEDEELRYKRLVELNVEEQCINILKTAEVQRAQRDRDLTVHGWVFDVHSGKLIDLKIDFIKLLENIKEIYRLD